MVDRCSLKLCRDGKWIEVDQNCVVMSRSGWNRLDGTYTDVDQYCVVKMRGGCNWLKICCEDGSWMELSQDVLWVWGLM
jgi:hypothetical protein